jgi:predicted DNA repair protein MutK
VRLEADRLTCRSSVAQGRGFYGLWLIIVAIGRMGGFLFSPKPEQPGETRIGLDFVLVIPIIMSALYCLGI